MLHIMKITPVAAELFHGDGKTCGRSDERTDGQRDIQMTKLKISFRDFANALKTEGARIHYTAL